MPKLTPLGLLTKWAILPASMVVLGYFVLGPYIITANRNGAPSPDVAPAPGHAAPVPVVANTHKKTAHHGKRKARHMKKKPKAPSITVTPPPASPQPAGTTPNAPPDPAGAGGAMSGANG